MNIDLTSLFPDLEALTPDGRWAMLQDWLANNPEYGERIAGWSTQSVDQVFVEIRDLTVKKYGPLALMVFTVPVAAAKVKSAITLLQACYRERQAYDNQPLEKEIKNVRANRAIEQDGGSSRRRSKQNGKAKSPKRTDQA
jgi:hypothetical protein